MGPGRLDGFLILAAARPRELQVGAGRFVPPSRLSVNVVPTCGTGYADSLLSPNRSAANGASGSDLAAPWTILSARASPTAGP